MTLNAVVVPAVALQTKFSPSKKSPTNPGNMPIISTFVFSTARFSVSMSIRGIQPTWDCNPHPRPGTKGSSRKLSSHKVSKICLVVRYNKKVHSFCPVPPKTPAGCDPAPPWSKETTSIKNLWFLKWVRPGVSKRFSIRTNLIVWRRPLASVPSAIFYQ